MYLFDNNTWKQNWYFTCMVWINISQNIKDMYVHLKSPIEELWDELDREDLENVSKNRKKSYERN